jgi:hypothetical protein
MLPVGITTGVWQHIFILPCGVSHWPLNYILRCNFIITKLPKKYPEVFTEANRLQEMLGDMKNYLHCIP